MKNKLIPKNINGNILKTLEKLSLDITPQLLEHLIATKPNIAKLLESNISSLDRLKVINSLRNKSFSKNPLFNNYINKILGYKSLRSNIDSKYWINRKGEIRHGFHNEDLQDALLHKSETLKRYTPKNLSNFGKKSRLENTLDTAYNEDRNIRNSAPINGAPNITEDALSLTHADLKNLIHRALEKYAEAITHKKIDDFKGSDINYINGELKFYPRIAKYLGIEDLDIFRKNRENLAEAYTPNSYNTRKLIGRLLFDLFQKSGKAELEVNYDLDKINAYYKDIVWPLIVENIKNNSAYIPKELFLNLKRMFEHPAENVDMKMGYTPVGTVGYSNGSNFIRFKLGTKPTEETIVHELHHSLRTRLGEILKGNNFAQSPHYNFGKLLSKNPDRAYIQKNYPLYFDDEKDIMKKIGLFSEKLREDLTPTAEFGATVSGNLKYAIWDNLRNELGRNPTRLELYNYIDTIPLEKLLNMFDRKAYGPWIVKEYNSTNPFVSDYDGPVGGYFADYPEQYYQMSGALKKGMKKIAGLAIPIGLGTTITLKSNNYES